MSDEKFSLAMLRDVFLGARNAAPRSRQPRMEYDRGAGKLVPAVSMRPGVLSCARCGKQTGTLLLISTSPATYACSRCEGGDLLEAGAQRMRRQRLRRQRSIGRAER